MASPNDRELNLLSNGVVESFWDALWLGIQRFLCFDEEISYNRGLASPNDRELNLLPNGAVESFWDALCLELCRFLCCVVECRRMIDGRGSKNIFGMGNR